MLGNLRKMQATLGETVQYQLPLSDQLVALNPLLGKNIQLEHSGNISCIHCDRPIKKSFNQGYCYPCFTTLAQCDMCIMKPETCHYKLGTCRQPDWAQDFCFQPHIVYLANSSGAKVGITRASQIPTRWIDQGAVQALPILRTTSRLVCGLLEVAIAQYVSDKTSWQKMLKAAPEAIDLLQTKKQLLDLASNKIADIKQQFGDSITCVSTNTATNINFPVLIYPTKVRSLNFAKNRVVSGILQGIKGQYLLLDTGVINIRKFGGYEVEFSC